MEKFSFEEGLKRLEEIVEKLEAGNVPLEDAISLYEEGMKLAKALKEKLDEIEMKVEKLMETEKGFRTEEFRHRTEEDEG